MTLKRVRNVEVLIADFEKLMKAAKHGNVAGGEAILG